jgi:4,5-DOPA dioxygenase extradiol
MELTRRTFLQSAGIGAMTMMTTRELGAELLSLKTGEKMPALFVGHGSPMNAIEENEYVTGWRNLAYSLPKPKAILVVSAHWLTHGTHVLSVAKPETIHDFYGFPETMYKITYPAPGAPELAKETKEILSKTKTVDLADDWGFDHGTWSVLVRMFPNADIPVYQLSLDVNDPPAKHYELANDLAALRSKGVLIVGSGNIVHNLRMISFEKSGGFDWAIEFDEKIKGYIEARNDQAVVDYEKLGTAARLSVPTNDHYLPLLYTLAATDAKEPIAFYNAKTDLGSMSMTSVKIG